MSEQPRRRRRQIESDDVPQIPQDDFIVMPVEENFNVQPAKLRHQRKKGTLNTPCLVSAGVCVVIIIIAEIILNQRTLMWSKILSHVVIPIGLVLLIACTFMLEVMAKRIPTIICAVAAIVLAFCKFPLYAIMLYWSIDALTWNKLINSLTRNIPILLPYVVLLVFAIMKKKRRTIWIGTGTTILLFQIVPALFSPINVWQLMSFGNRTIGAMGVGLGNTIRYGLPRLFDFVYGLVFFFGMINVPGKKRTSDKVYNTNDCPLLEQYKREHGM